MGFFDKPNIKLYTKKPNLNMNLIKKKRTWLILEFKSDMKLINIKNEKTDA